jgi:hypothetical protein
MRDLQRLALAVAVTVGLGTGLAWSSDASTSLGPSPADLEIERFLLEGNVIDEKEIPVGISRPLKLTLQLDGETMVAAFKTIDLMLTGKTDFPDGSYEMNFVDSYKNDRAAYLLDRQLGLNMVPVAVLRKYKGKSGAMVAWVSDAFDERERREKDLRPDDHRVLSRQQDRMKIFETLLLNVDLNQTNMLYTPDWKLHLIDHSRAFRSWKSVPDSFKKNLLTLTRELLANLEALEEQQVRELLKGLVPKSKVKALMSRRDIIVQKIAADREKFGDWAVFPEQPEE